MKKVYKKICTILSICILVSTLPFSFGVFATEEGSLLTAGQEGLLHYLNITLEENNVSYEKAITRGEMAHIIAKVIKVNDYTGSESYFLDVPMDYRYAKDVLALVEEGVLHGDGNGKYRPDDLISEAEVSKVFVAALGYKKLDNIAIFQQVARMVGIIDGVELDGIVTYAEALLMAYNTLHCGVLEGVVYSEEKVESKVNPNYLALEKYHGLVYHEGLLDGIGGTTIILENDEILDGQVRINGKIYTCDREDLFGYAVVYYAKRDELNNKRPQISYIYADDRKNNTVVIEAEDVIGKSGNNFGYFVNDKKREVPLIEVPDVIYNGMPYPECSDAELKPGAGTVTLIDNNGDKIYDIICVISYEYVVLESINTEDGIIRAKYPNQVIGSANRENEIVFKYGNLDAYPGSLQTGDVLAVRASRNVTGVLKITIDHIPMAVTGTFEGVSGNDYTVAGKTYERIDATVIDREPRLGELVNVYSHNGKCVAIIHAQEDGYQYGYLLNMVDTGSAFASKARVQLMNRDGKKVEMDLAEKVLLDETSIKTQDFNRISTLLQTSALESYRPGAETLYAQLIRFKVNGDGAITHIDTAHYDSTKETEDSLRVSFSQANENLGRLHYNGVNKAFNVDGADIGGDANQSHTIFHVSDAWATVEDERDEEMSWKTPSLGSTNRRYYPGTQGTLEAYNIDPITKVAKMTLLYQPSSSGGISPSQEYTGRPGIVAGFEKTLEADGVVATRIRLFGRSSGVTSLPLAEDLVSAAATLKVGDVIDIAVKNGEIVNYTLLFKLGEGMKSANPYSKEDESNILDYGRDLRLAYGTVLNYQGGYLRHTTTTNVANTLPENYTQHYSYMVDTADVYLYDSAEPNKGIQTGGLLDLLPYEQNHDSVQKTIICSVGGKVVYAYIIQ